MFRFTMKELQFISQKMLYKQLVGVGHRLIIGSKVKQGLINKGIVIQKEDGRLVLREPEAKLFDTWANATCYVAGLQNISDRHMDIVVYNKTHLLSCHYNENVVDVEFVDRATDDSITRICNLATARADIVSSYNCSVKMHLNEYIEFCYDVERDRVSPWAIKLGFDYEQLVRFISEMHKERDNENFIVSTNLFTDVSELTEVIEDGNQLLLLTHVSYPTDDKAVLLTVGGSSALRDVVMSI